MIWKCLWIGSRHISRPEGWFNHREVTATKKITIAPDNTSFIWDAYEAGADAIIENLRKQGTKTLRDDVKKEINGKQVTIYRTGVVVFIPDDNQTE